MIFSNFWDSHFLSYGAAAVSAVAVGQRECGSAHYTKIGDAGGVRPHVCSIQPLQRRRRGLWTSLEPDLGRFRIRSRNQRTNLNPNPDLIPDSCVVESDLESESCRFESESDSDS